MAGVSVRFAVEAAEELQAAMDWYVERSAAASLDFADEISRAIERIRASPERWPEAGAEIRRHGLHRFPFVVFYRMKEGSIQIIALAHAKRRPGYWRKRLKRH